MDQIIIPEVKESQDDHKVGLIDLRSFDLVLTFSLGTVLGATMASRKGPWIISQNQHQ